MSEAEQDGITAITSLLMQLGSRLPFPYSSGVKGSRHQHMRELRVQNAGHPIRVFYAFDLRRAAILLIGGNKTGDKRLYNVVIPLADRLYDAHLDEVRDEGLIP